MMPSPFPINSFILNPPKSESSDSGVPRNFFRGVCVCSTNSVEDRENGDLGVVAP